MRSLLKHGLRGLRPETLQIDERRLAGGRLEATKEGARSERKTVREPIEIGIVGEIIMQPSLAHSRVGVIAPERKYSEAYLVGSRHLED